MNKIIRYGLYEGKLFLRTKTAVFYSIIFPIILLLMYYAANYSSGSFDNINAYFPYLVSITMISTAGGLATLIVNNRVYNTWKFYNFFGYKTWHMAIATGLIYFLLSEVICCAMAAIMILFLGTIKITMGTLLAFIIAAGFGTIIYIEIAVITGLSINEPRNAQTIITGFIYLFVILSGSIFRFEQGSIMGKIMLVFPNIHIGNLLYTIWNYGKADLSSITVLTIYAVIFSCVIWYLIKKEQKKLLY